MGSAWSWLNRAPGTGTRSNELILQTYYQAHVLGPIFVQPTLSYMPNPGQTTALPGATGPDVAEHGTILTSCDSFRLNAAAVAMARRREAGN